MFHFLAKLHARHNVNLQSNSHAKPLDSRTCPFPPPKTTKNINSSKSARSPPLSLLHLVLLPPSRRPPLPRITRRAHNNPFLPRTPHPRPHTRPPHLQLPLPLLPRLRRRILRGTVLSRRGRRHIRLQRWKRLADLGGQPPR